MLSLYIHWESIKSVNQLAEWTLCMWYLLNYLLTWYALTPCGPSVCLFLAFALTPAIRRGRSINASGLTPATGFLSASWGIWQKEGGRERERELGTPVWALHTYFFIFFIFYIRSTPPPPPSSTPPILSVSSCRFSFSSVLALPHGALQRAAATCWRPPHTTNWNLDLTTPPKKTSLTHHPQPPSTPFFFFFYHFRPPCLPLWTDFSASSLLLMPVFFPHPPKLSHLFLPASFSLSLTLSFFLHPSIPSQRASCSRQQWEAGCLWLESIITLSNVTNQQRRALLFALEGATCCSFTWCFRYISPHKLKKI